MAGQTFTTYINAKRTGSVEAEFAAMGQRAERTLSGIQAKAERANRALAGLTGGRGSGGLGQSPVTQAYLGGFDQATMKAERLRQAQERLARENSRLVQGLRTTGQTLQIVQGPLGPIAGRVNAAADALARLTGISLGLAGAGAALFAYARAANQFVEIRSKLATLYDSQQDVNKALSDVAGVANRARSGLAPVADLYARMKMNSDELGLSQQRLLKITETVAKAARMSGGGPAVDAAVGQLGQAIGGGGEAIAQELNSIKEQAPGIARALSEGLAKLPEFKGIDVGISKLKKLAEEGKLAGDVIPRALEAAANSVEERFKRLPPSLASSMTALQTNATMFVGRFEEATGVVGTLATGVLLLGNNLTLITAAAGGLAAAWAAVALQAKLADEAGGLKRMLAGMREQQQQARTALDQAAHMHTSTVQQTIALKEQENVRRANIVRLERELLVQKQIAAEMRLQATANPAGPGRRLGVVADANVVRITRELADEVEHLGVVQTNTATAGRKLEGQTKALDVAKRNAGKTTSLFKMGLTSLLGAINPLGIAVALATSAFLAWALAEGEAAKNAKKVEDAQRQLANVIDFTTGKIIEQNAVLQANARLNAGQGMAAANTNYNTARNQIFALGDRFRPQVRQGARGDVASNPTVSPGQRTFLNMLERYRRREIDVQGLQRLTEVLAKQDPSMRALADQVTELSGRAVTAAQDVYALDASLKILGGDTSAETLRRANKDFSGGRAADQAASGKTDAQIAADIEAERKRLRDKRYAAEVQMNEQLQNLEKRRSKMSVDEYTREAAQIKATYDSAIEGLNKQDAAAERRAQREEERKRKAHERELARIEAENQAREKRTEKRSDILQQWSEDPKAVIRARDQIEDLRRMVGDTMNGIAEITEKNPLGQGIYTAEMAARDAANIEEGLQRPYNDYMEARQRELNIQELLLAGRDLEAEALRRAYDLYDDIGTLTGDQYNSILNNLRVEERINDALAQRERLMAPLRETVTGLRDDVTGMIESLMSGGNPLKAGKNVLKGLFDRFTHADAVQWAEKLTSGLDQRVRDMMRGSVSVDQKIADYVSALDTSGQVADGLSSALNNAANAANHAAGALNGIAGSPGVVGGAGSALGAGGSAIMGAGGSALLGLLGASVPGSFFKGGVRSTGHPGEAVLYQALGGLGALITETTRPQSRQDQYYRQGLTPARVSDHTTTPGTFDVRLPKGMSFAQATAMVRKQAAEMGLALVKAVDETQRGGTGRHAHYVLGAGRGAYAGYGGIPGPASGALGDAIGGIMGGGGQIAVQAIKTVGEIADKLGKGPMSQAPTGDPDEIIVTGTRRAKTPEGVPSAADHYNKLGQEIGASLDKALGTKFLAGIGKHLGTALQGAATGQMASGLAKALGLKQSNTGAQLGGAAGAVIGNMLLPGIGGIIGGALGGLAGGTIGGMFKKTKKASVTVSSTGGGINVGRATGNSGSREKAATSAGGALGGEIQRIADMLGVAVGAFSVSIGMRKDTYRVDPTGKGRTKNMKSFETEEEAIRYALMDAIKDGALRGLSAASNTILKKAKDLESALNKVMVIESIPKRLMQIKDPVRFALTELNREFAKMIEYLREGQATAAQFAEAQELYDLERQRAIEQASQQSIGAIQDYINEMLGGSSSPLNRMTVYDNAKATLSPFQADIAAGKSIDNDALLKAVANFQEASQQLNGSGASFFADFDMLLGLLTAAKANVTAASTAAGALPGSPFADPGIQALINGTATITNAVNEQGRAQRAILQALLDKFGGSMPNLSPSTAINQLPSSRQASGGTSLAAALVGMFS